MAKRKKEAHLCGKDHSHNPLTCIVAEHPGEVVAALFIILALAVTALIIVTINYSQCRELAFS